MLDRFSFFFSTDGLVKNGISAQDRKTNGKADPLCSKNGPFNSVAILLPS